ncbi:minichromosome maintenance protein MCM [Candidatus Woesearchaeota archaeon]|nr:minichromosome maintenance protein MCM [Candidatus Woesearchaeota archaeon]
MESQDLIEQFKEFIELHHSNHLHELIRQEKKSLTIDFQELVSTHLDLGNALLKDPEDVTRAAELALEQFDLPQGHQLKSVRFRNLPKGQFVRIANIRSEHLNKFLWVEGVVRQASDVRPQVTSARFECGGCGNTLSLLQIDTKFREPNRCSCGWRGKFNLLSKELVDVQHLKIEEAPESLEGGEQPKRLSVFVKEDLVDPKMEKRTAPGSKINIYGVVKEVPIPLKTGAQSTRFDLILEANNIEPVQEDYSDITISREEEQQIIALAQDPKLFEKFTQAIAPSVYGYEKIKEALVLQLVGAARRVKGDATVMRGDIHILLIGDPGSAKSTLLTFVAKAAPKARFVAGTSASGAGLTASVVKDEFLRGWALEAGAMVLANKGILCADEIDKMGEDDRAALHSAMEQQVVTISKANIQATLSAQTTMLAAANPKLGRFDPYSPLASQIDLPPTLINRFDLIFPIRDIPNKEKDEKIALHVLETSHQTETYATEVSVEFLRKYVAYVKQKIFPTMTKQAINEIKDFYVSLRNSAQAEEGGVKPIPISARQLEALIRLSEASARLRLDNKVTREDARRAIDLLRYCLMQVGIDPETGQIDIDRITTGISASARSKILLVKDLIAQLESKGIKTIALQDLIAEAHTHGLEESKVEEAIEQLRKSGDIFEPKKGYIQRI